MTGELNHWMINSFCLIRTFSLSAFWRWLTLLHEPECSYSRVCEEQFIFLLPRAASQCPPPLGLVISSFVTDAIQSTNHGLPTNNYHETGFPHIWWLNNSKWTLLCVVLSLLKLSWSSLSLFENQHNVWGNLSQSKIHTEYSLISIVRTKYSGISVKSCYGF